jgi:aldose 1-epimerase
MPITLQCHSRQAVLLPELGGGMAAFSVAGRDVLRRAPDDAHDPLTLAEFPMAPYVNRIAHGAFRWRGEAVHLPRNAEGQRHPLHGTGWRRPWAGERLSDTAARLTLQSEADAAWPWAVRMTRTFTLSEEALAIDFALTNADARPMPASLGLHPFFPAAADARLQFRAATQLLTTPDVLPTHEAATATVTALAAGVAVRELDLDHCFAGWDGVAAIDWPGLSLRIETEPSQRFIQVYAPPGQGLFCVEPQSAPPDAPNRGGCVELMPGERLAFTTRFVVSAY